MLFDVMMRRRRRRRLVSISRTLLQYFSARSATASYHRICHSTGNSLLENLYVLTLLESQFSLLLIVVKFPLKTMKLILYLDEIIAQSVALFAVLFAYSLKLDACILGKLYTVYMTLAYLHNI